MITVGSKTGSNVRFLDDLFGRSTLQRVAFRFEDGTVWPDDRPREAVFVLKRPGALREMFEPGTEIGLAEAYLHDAFDIEGDIESAFELAEALRRRGRQGWLKLLKIHYDLHRLPAGGKGSRFRPRHSLESDRRAVSFHYDVSNDFFRLWLDQGMSYSCAYFEHARAGIDEAQEAKLRHTCGKLRLRPGQRLLDIGCGWGALAIFAARQFGIRVTGVTLSQRQAELAAERVRAAGLGDRVSIELKDYREVRVPEPFDAIVSVGMSEHVGAAGLPGYFKRAGELLQPGGVFLNHAIGEGARPPQRIGSSFINEYIFPDSEVPPLREVAGAAELAGFEVRDVENLREHYALTLRHWFRRLEAFHEQARAFVSEEIYRLWRLYMAGSAHAFATAQLAVYQMLLSKPDAAGHAHMPLTRADWYR
jgi:cyclopropane-fatty-acyl-phospholipid synthase